MWAGQYRQVNVSKGGFAFVAARYIPKLMQELEKGALRKYTPCTFNTDEEIVEALAVVHAELMLIHPFREGNGRAGRLFVVLMAFQASGETRDKNILLRCRRAQAGTMNR